ncbi:fatty acid synthase-like [Melitaea cinxia]|uniref:fatty acid synthase-like n=1 Tax=Melitaea cinxia TaxID=113334 RepID=UPI001E273251|nr:fatty acid synthase-like [Melitaea cinxia]
MESITKTFAETPDVDMGTISGDKVVISGMAGLYPESHNVKELSDILYNKINPINSENSRWKYDHPEVAQYTGKVPELDLFDAQFFKVHYRLGNNMDPMGRKILEQAYQAIYDSGMSPKELDGKKICVYVGCCFSETEKACFYAESSVTGMGITGCSKSMFANRISYWLNGKGPSIAVDAACNSSTRALELAYQAITRGECEAAIVGGASLSLHPQSTIHYGRILKVSMDGKTKSFDNDPNGCAKSEAINILFLQKAKDARRIYAEVVHVKSEFNSLPKGEKHARYGFYRNPSLMAKFIRDFYEEAKIKPEAVEYVEAFGSANAEADKAELEAIEEVYCSNRNDPLLVGSVISNIGYGEAATGISAVTKVLLAYHTGKIAANLHCEVPRQDVAALREGRMRVVTDHQEFGRNYTAVNGLSVTGINSHVLLKGHYKPKDLSLYKSNIPQLLTISGRQESSVMKIFEDIKTRPIDPEELALFRNIHKTSIFGHMGRGYTILDTNDENETFSLSEKVDYYDDVKHPLWFVYSGMGSQWAGMGAQLMRIPIFAASIERCRRVLEPKGIDIVHIITSPDKNIFDNILNSFVGIAAIQIGLTDILSEMGIFPDNIIGHSVGELGCAYADGCFTAEEMILSAYSRGLVSLQTPFIRGSMAAVGVGFQKISKLCPPEIEVACHNGPDSCTISGPEDIMKEFVADLTSKQIFAKEVPCSNIAYHSRYIAEAGPGLLKHLSEVIKSPKPRSERWLSTSVPQEQWGELSAKYSSAEYHTNNLLNPVLFEETSTLIPPNAVLVEIAPHGLLQAILKRSLPESCKHIPLTRRGHPDNATFFLEAIGKLYMEGYNPKVEAIYPKIEYPVSTGTPMLSHLVEWAHNERWNLPLYEAAHRKTAAACKFVLSTQDDDNEYLKGHVIREKNMFPFAAVLVAVWDTLAMSLGVEKKKLSVQFIEVQQYSQLVFYDQRQVSLSVALHRGSGKFEVLSNKTKVATGFIIGNEKGKKEMVPATTESDENMVLDSNDIYHLFHSRDYNYSGEFRCIYNANQSLDEANILWKDNWITFIDGLIQLNTLRRNNESVSQLHTIKKLVIDVQNHLGHKKILNDGTTVMKAKVNEYNESISCGGVQMFSSRFYDLPSMNKNFTLKSVQFVPHYTKDKLDKTSALYVTLQVVAENLKKQEISVAELVDNKTDKSEYNELNKIINDIPGIRIQYSTVRRCEALKQHDFLKDVDVVVVNNLSNDENLARVLHQVRTRNSFLINTEYTKETAKSPSLMLYHTVCAHTTGSMCVELALWHPTGVQNLKGIWSGEYYLPIREKTIGGRDMMLKIKQPGELDTLYWAEAPDTSTDGVKVKVHYAGINDVDVKKKSGFMALDENNENTFLDFSGVTESGERVMGIVYDKSIKTTVRANPNLLWPVPDHWTLEDAATVPLAYSLAFYCLVNVTIGISILVHGGAGALGQAIISIALAHGCQVFTTVSDNKKKQFLLRLFPDLKEEHIVSSRDISGTDKILNATNGQGVNLLICSVRGQMKNATLRCCKMMASVVDTAVLPNREDYNLGMMYLFKGISYYTLDMYSILELHKQGELKELQAKVIEGIARGFVRPLSRVTYSAPLAPRAYRLQAASRHRGRVLLDLRGEPAAVHPHRHRGRVLLDLRGEPAAVHPHRHRGRVLLDLRGEPAAVHPHRHRGRVLLDLRGEPAAVHPHRHRGRVLLDLRGEPAAVHPHRHRGRVLLDLRGEPAAVHPHRHRGRVLLDLRGEPAAVHPHRHRGRVLLDLRGEPAAVHPHRHRGRVLLDLRGEPAAVHPHRHRGRVLLDLRGEPAAVHPHRHRGRVLLDLRGEPAAVHPHRHRGRVLLDLRGEPAAVHPHRHRGRVLLDLRGEPAAVHPQNWKSQGVNVELLDKNMLKGSLSNIIKKNKSLKGIEGIYYVVSPDAETASAKRNLEQLLLTSQIYQTTLKLTNTLDENQPMEQAGFRKDFSTIDHIHVLRQILQKYREYNKYREQQQYRDYIKRYMLREKKEKWTRIITEWYPRESRRSRGRQPKRWEDDLMQVAGPEWLRIHITKDTPRDATLRDLGVDGTKLELLRVHLRDVWLTLLNEEEIDLMTISNFIDLGESLSEKVFKEIKGLETFISYIDCDEILATTETVFLPSLTNISNECDDEFDVNQTYLCVVPGADGHHARFRTLCERSKLPALVMQPGLDDPHETIQDIADRFAKTFLKKTKVPDGFYLLGYESGVMVALEMAAILEDKGLTGTVFCLGGTPKEIQEHFEEILKDYKTDDELQNAIIRHMYTLMTNNEDTGKREKLDSVLSNKVSWNEKVTACVNLASGQVVHSNQYTEELIKAAYGRILQVRRYNYEPRQLRSQLICIRPRSSKICKTSNLQQYSLKPVIEYELQAPFAIAAEDLSCSNIVNRHLDPAISEAFEKKNLCETYILSSSFMVN